MFKVRDIMTARVLSVAIDDTAASAADLMRVEGISGLAVRDAAGRFVGVLSQSDLSNPRLPGKVRHPTVEDIMTADLMAVYADDSALAAATKMAEHDVHRMFVLDKDRKLVGVVSALDVVKAVARGADFDARS
jgi:CBS domain-containing protein